MSEPPWSAEEPFVTVGFDEVGDDHLWCSSYVERFWLPVLGPTCILLGRRLTRLEAARVGDGDTTLCVLVQVLAIELGLGSNVMGKNSALYRAFDRLQKFHVARFDDRKVWLVDSLPEVSEGQQRRWPPGLVRAHDRALGRVTT